MTPGNEKRRHTILDNMGITEQECIKKCNIRQSVR